jgi:tRNA(Arg) A34 adenosine deaminase TadA
MSDKDNFYMREAIALARQGIEAHDGGPFGAVIVMDDKLVGRGWNRVVAGNDPTAHAEINAIRDACRRLGRFHLQGATLYTSCEPCPMCLSAAYWAEIETIVYGADERDAAKIGFNDLVIRKALQQPIGARRMASRQVLRGESLRVLEQWSADPRKVRY